MKRTTQKGKPTGPKPRMAMADIKKTGRNPGLTRGGGGPIGKNATGMHKHNINCADTYNTMPAGYKRGK